MKKKADWRNDKFVRCKVGDVSGIYAIINTETKKKYVGQSIHLQARRETHWVDLLMGAHANRFMQSDFNKYGKDVWVFVVLELVQPFKKLLDEREQYWINKIHAKYNLMKDISYANAFYSPAEEPILIHIGETYKRPAWHKWVYGSGRNPLLSRSQNDGRMPHK